jgi:hypothetical protein
VLLALDLPTIVEETTLAALGQGSNYYSKGAVVARDVAGMVVVASVRRTRPFGRLAWLQASVSSIGGSERTPLNASRLPQTAPGC